MERLRRRLEREDADRRGTLLEVDAEAAPALGAEDVAAMVAARAQLAERQASEGSGRFARLEID